MLDAQGALPETLHGLDTFAGCATVVAGVVGGVLLGWSAMTALGCTFGVLLSGTQAFALSGWVFLVTFAAGAALAFRLRLHEV